VSKSLRRIFGALFLAMIHHSPELRNASFGIGKSAPDQLRTLCQTRCEKRQHRNRCVQFSLALWQRGQAALCGQPLRARLSAVKHRLCTTNHIKKVALSRALGPRNRLATSEVVLGNEENLVGRTDGESAIGRAAPDRLVRLAGCQYDVLQSVP
jgi:hypothetical protein